MRASAFLAAPLLGVVLLSGDAPEALQIDTLNVGYSKGRYHLEATVLLAAPRDAVFAVITDYAQLPRLNEHIVESRVIERERPGVSLVMTRVRGCLMLICRELTRVERIEERVPSELLSETLPERSDMRYETASWRFESAPGGTRLNYRLEVEPNIWIPFFGRGAVKRELLRSFERTVGSVERLAAPVVAHP